jgi:CobQ/CobB/MinD/ParA nucleotide binding domain
MKIVRFNQALEIARGLLAESELIRHQGVEKFLLIRDLYGRLRLLCPALEGTEKLELSTQWLEALGTSADSTRPLLFDTDFFNAAQIRTNPHLQFLSLDAEGQREIPFADRGVIGADWLQAAFPEKARDKDAPHPKRIVFFGLKGGVGRTTALCLTARHFAKQGLKVLVLDVDLESPGLSSLLLPPTDLPPLGIIDWFVEDALEQASKDLLADIVSTSPLASNWPGIIRVAPAFGREESGYIPKLSRVYADLSRPGSQQMESFPERFFRMLGELEAAEKPDVVLLDSRAGMHDIAATLLVRVPDALRLIFASHSPQTWAGYRRMFEHWRSFPRHLASFRNGLQLVDAMMPETGRHEHQQAFSSAAYSLFNETLYEDVPAGSEVGDIYNFPEEDTDAPHSAPSILWDRKFMEFDPANTSSSFHDEDLIRLCYGEFLTSIDDRLQISPTSPS